MIHTFVLLFITLMVGALHAEPIQIVAFGASNTYGAHLRRSEAYPAQLEAMLRAAGYDVVLKNEGTNGQTTSEQLSKLNSAVPNGTRIVIFAPGGNDQNNRSKSLQFNDTERNIQSIVQTLLDRKILVLFCGGPRQREYVERFNVPTMEAIYEMAPNDSQFDGKHLTAKGYRIAAEKMLPSIKVLLERVRANDAQLTGPSDAKPLSSGKPATFAVDPAKAPRAD
jgi:acyl-CoA thioesterase I